MNTMNETLTIRASFAPIAARCPASCVPPQLRIERSGIEARNGSAAHQVLQNWSAGGPAEGDIDHAVTHWSADRDEVAILAWQGWRLREALAEHFPDAETEVEMRAEIVRPDGHRVLLTGHADLLSVVGDQVRVLDWKTGYADADYDAQLRSYAWLALQRHPECQSAYVALVRVRNGTVDGDGFTRAALEAWAARLADGLRHLDVYSPEEATCAYCPRSHECPAKTALVVSAMDRLLGNYVDDLPPHIAQRGPAYVHLLDQAKLLMDACENLRGVIKADVLAHGPLPTGDGRQLEIVTQEQHPIDLAAGLPVLRDCDQIPGDEMIFNACRVSKSELERTIRDNSLPRQGARNIRDLYERLREAGALRTEYVQRLEVKRQTKRTGALTDERTTGSPSPAESTAGPEHAVAD